MKIRKIHPIPTLEKEGIEGEKDEIAAGASPLRNDGRKKMGREIKEG